MHDREGEHDACRSAPAGIAGSQNHAANGQRNRRDGHADRDRQKGFPGPVAEPRGADDEGLVGAKEERAADIGEHLADRHARAEDRGQRRRPATGRSYRGGRRRVSRFAAGLGCLGGAQSLGGRRVDEPGGLPGRDSVQHLVHARRPSERSPD